MKNSIEYLIAVFIAILSSVSSGYAQGKAIFTGKIITDQGTPKLDLIITRHPLLFINDEWIWNIPVNAQGDFKFEVDFDEGDIAYITVLERTSNSRFFSNAKVSIGDNVNLNVNIKGRAGDDLFGGGDLHPKIKFTGKGALKFEVWDAMYAVNKKQVTGQFVPQRLSEGLFRLIRQKMNILELYESRITVGEFDLLKRDMLAHTLDVGLHHIFIKPTFQKSDPEVLKSNMERAKVLPEQTYLEFSQLYKNDDSISFNKRREVYKQLLTQTESILKDEQIAESPFSDCYFLGRIISETTFLNNGEAMYFEDVVKYLNRKYSGLVRDRVLCKLIRDNASLFIPFRDPNNLNSIISESLKSIKNPLLLAEIKKISRTRVRGEAPYNFSFPADSSGKMVKLSDLKGKVVLVDMGSDGCTGCYKFANAFHKEVYPIFKNNPNFKVVSILSMKSHSNYLKVVKGENAGPTFTYPEYINLFSKRDSKEDRQMGEYYGLTGWPFLQLIGKDGKVYSSNIPRVDDPKNIPTLINLIKQALAE